MIALLLLLAAAPERLVLMDETVTVPAAAWRAFDLELRQRPAVIDCRFSVKSGGSGVRVALMHRADVERLRAGESHRVLASTAYERSHRLRYRAAEGAYGLVVDNRLEGRGPAEVQLEVALVFEGPEPVPQVLSPARRAVVVAASILFFAAVVFFAGRKLRAALKRQAGSGPPFAG